jgi:hypothetical protein
MAAVNTARIKSVSSLHDGRKYVTEEILDTQGNFHPHLYLAAAGEDLQAHLLETQAQYEDALQVGELDRHYHLITERGSAAVITLRFVTPAQMRSYLRERFRETVGVQAAKLAQFLLTLTDNQLKSLFTVNDAQLATLKQRLQTRADIVDDVDSMVGE